MSDVSVLPTAAADTDPPVDRVLDSGDVQPIPPSIDHSVQPIGHVQLYLEFLRPATLAETADHRPPS